MNADLRPGFGQASACDFENRMVLNKALLPAFTAAQYLWTEGYCWSGLGFPVQHCTVIHAQLTEISPMNTVADRLVFEGPSS